MSNLVSEELDAIHASEIALAAHIQKTVLADIEAGKFSHYELIGRLGRSHIGVEALKTRKTWTLRYAIHIARKLGYSLGTLEVVKHDESGTRDRQQAQLEASDHQKSDGA